MSYTKKDYVESQSEALCGQHALNHVYGMKRFTTNTDMSGSLYIHGDKGIAKPATLTNDIQINLANLCTTTKDGCIQNQWFSSQILQKAIETSTYTYRTNTINPSDSESKIKLINALQINYNIDDYVGSIVNLGKITPTKGTGGTHWAAIKKGSIQCPDKPLYIDSMKIGEKQCIDSFETFFTSMQVNEFIHIFRKEPGLNDPFYAQNSVVLSKSQPQEGPKQPQPQGATQLASSSLFDKMKGVIGSKENTKTKLPEKPNITTISLAGVSIVYPTSYEDDQRRLDIFKTIQEIQQKQVKKGGANTNDPDDVGTEGSEENDEHVQISEKLLTQLDRLKPEERQVLTQFGMDDRFVLQNAEYIADFLNSLPNCTTDTSIMLNRQCESAYFLMMALMYRRHLEAKGKKPLPALSPQGHAEAAAIVRGLDVLQKPELSKPPQTPRPQPQQPQPGTKPPEDMEALATLLFSILSKDDIAYYKIASLQ